MLEILELKKKIMGNPLKLHTYSKSCKKLSGIMLLVTFKMTSNVLIC